MKHGQSVGDVLLETFGELQNQRRHPSAGSASDTGWEADDRTPKTTTHLLRLFPPFLGFGIFSATAAARFFFF